MAKLKECRRCGYYPVGKNALACPSCGSVSPAPGIVMRTYSFFVKVLFVGIALAVVLAVLAAYI